MPFGIAFVECVAGDAEFITHIHIHTQQLYENLLLPISVLFFRIVRLQRQRCH